MQFGQLYLIIYSLYLNSFLFIVNLKVLNFKNFNLNFNSLKNLSLQGNYAEAMRAHARYEETLILNPENAFIAKTLGLQDPKNDKLKSKLQEEIDNGVKNSVFVADILVDQGKYKEANLKFLEAISIDPKNNHQIRADRL